MACKIGKMKTEETVDVILLRGYLGIFIHIGV